MTSRNHHRRLGGTATGGSSRVFREGGGRGVLGKKDGGGEGRGEGERMEGEEEEEEGKGREGRRKGREGEGGKGQPPHPQVSRIFRSLIVNQDHGRGGRGENKHTNTRTNTSVHRPEFTCRGTSGFHIPLSIKGLRLPPVFSAGHRTRRRTRRGDHGAPPAATRDESSSFSGPGSSGLPSTTACS